MTNALMGYSYLASMHSTLERFVARNLTHMCAHGIGSFLRRAALDGTAMSAACPQLIAHPLALKGEGCLGRFLTRGRSDLDAVESSLLGTTSALDVDLLGAWGATSLVAGLRACVHSAVQRLAANLRATRYGIQTACTGHPQIKQIR